MMIQALDGDAASWDAFVAGAEQSTFCHVAAWRDILSGVLGAECLYSVARDDEGECRGVLPLVRVKSRLFGHYLVSLPFLNAGGPLGSPAARARLVESAVQEARRSGADLLELRTRDDSALDLPVATRKLTVLLPLPADADTLFNAFPAKLRSQIRRPMKDGLTVRFGADQCEPFYEVFARTMRDLGTPVLPRAFFERVATRLASLVEFGVVYGGDQPLAAGCGFAWRNEFEMTWAGALRESRPRSANMLLYWAFMQRAIERQVRSFDFGRCTAGSGTHHFKQQWGGVDVPLRWRHYRGRNAVHAPPSPDDPAYAWGPRVWRRLPLFIANRLGPRLVRFLP